MKSKLITIAMVVLASCFVFESCASSGKAYNGNSTNSSQMLTLKDWLQTLNGVRLVGTKVVIGTAQQDFQAGFKGALIVLDGDIVGRNYKAAGRLIPSGTVESIKVLSNAQASRYGSKAFEGVIIIKTTKKAAR